MIIGKQSIQFDRAPYILEASSVVGKKEGEGPLGKLFDRVEQDPMLGKDTWEEAESELQKIAAEGVLKKSGLTKADIRYILAGDLLEQMTATSFGLMDLEIPLFGLYGACSTMGEALSLGSMLISGGYGDHLKPASRGASDRHVLRHHACGDPEHCQALSERACDGEGGKEGADCPQGNSVLL